MSRRVVKRWEAPILMRAIEPAGRYLNRLVDRMYKQAFDRDDEVFKAAVAARDATHTLWVRLHYRSSRGPNGIEDPELDGAPPRCLLLLHLLH
jgi:hypothetical protein